MKLWDLIAYSGVWARYAEQLADEWGAYEDDPRRRQILLHAARLVVDTGPHAMR